MNTQRTKRTTAFTFVGPLVLSAVFSVCWAVDESAQGSEQASTRFPTEFVAGIYEVIGRYPDSEKAYSGTVEISLSDVPENTLSMTRKIGNTTIEGTGVITTTSGDAVVVLRSEFEGDAGITLEATYLIESDLDNYARLTGYVYAKGGGTSVPGIEALFHDHYRDRD